MAQMLEFDCVRSAKREFAKSGNFGVLITLENRGGKMQKAPLTRAQVNRDRLQLLEKDAWGEEWRF